MNEEELIKLWRKRSRLLHEASELIGGSCSSVSVDLENSSLAYEQCAYELEQMDPETSSSRNGAP
jgi:hypothetical protein